MTTTALPRGRGTTVALKSQTAFATPATGNYQLARIYSHTLTESKGFEDDPILGLPSQNARDQMAPAPALPTHGGQIVVPMCLNEIGHWLVSMFGLPVSTGTTNKVHTFASGGEVIPYRTAEFGFGGAFWQHVGLLGSKMTVDASRAAGYRRVTLDTVGRNQNKLGSTGAGTPVAALARDPVAGTLGQVLLNSVVTADLMSTRFEYDIRPSSKDDINGTDYASGYDLDQEATCSGSFKVRFRTGALYDAAVAAGATGVATPLELLFSKGANNALSFAMPAVRFEVPGVPIEGPGGVEVDYSFRAEQTAAAAMLTVTLKNQVTAYA